MPSRQDHARHAHGRAQETRRLIAVEAARLMAEDGIRDYHQAKLKAAQRLGIFEDGFLPKNAEIEKALREHQRLFQSDTQPRQLRHLREAAVEAMAFFEPFQPRLVGAVLEGTADEHSAVCLHLFSDDPSDVARFLHEHAIPFEENSRRIRVTRDEVAEYPVFLFAAEGDSIDLTVLPYDRLRQPPLDRVGERAMRRATRSNVEALLAEDEIAAYEDASSDDVRGAR